MQPLREPCKPRQPCSRPDTKRTRKIQPSPELMLSRRDIGSPVTNFAATLSDRGGIEAMQLRIGEEYVKQFGKLAQAGTTLVVPANLSDLASIVTMATSIARKPPAHPQAANPAG